MTQLGYSNKQDDEPTPCQHLNNWGLEGFGDYLFRTCFTCGTVWMMVETKSGVGWLQIEEVTGEDVQPMSAPEKPERVQSKPRKERRARSSVSDLPRTVEPITDPETYEGEISAALE
jgi:hypothetical protein